MKSPLPLQSPLKQLIYWQEPNNPVLSKVGSRTVSSNQLSPLIKTNSNLSLAKIKALTKKKKPKEEDMMTSKTFKSKKWILRWQKRDARSQIRVWCLMWILMTILSLTTKCLWLSRAQLEGLKISQRQQKTYNWTLQAVPASYLRPKRRRRSRTSRIARPQVSNWPSTSWASTINLTMEAKRESLSQKSKKTS